MQFKFKSKNAKGKTTIKNSKLFLFFASCFFILTFEFWFYLFTFAFSV